MEIFQRTTVLFKIAPIQVLNLSKKINIIAFYSVMSYCKVKSDSRHHFWLSNMKARFPAPWLILV